METDDNTRRPKMDAKTSLEWLNLQEVPELASLDEKGLEFMKNKARLHFGEEEEVKLTEKEEKELERLRAYQMRLLEQPHEVKDLWKQTHTEGETGHGLSELCTVETNGIRERILRLTEVFLPTKADEKVRRMMDGFNRMKMPFLRNSLADHVLEQRKRTIKADLKQASERAKALQTKIANGLYKPPPGGVDFLMQDFINKDELEHLRAEKRNHKMQGRMHKLERVQAARNREELSLHELAQRKRAKIGESPRSSNNY